MSNITSLKFPLGFPDMNEWKIFYFNRLVEEPEIRITAPQDKDFIGLYFNLGNTHEYRITDQDAKTIKSGEYNFVYLPERSTHLIVPHGLYSALCIEFTTVILKKVKEWCPMIDSILKYRGTTTPGILSKFNMIITSDMRESILGIVLNKQNYRGHLKEIVDHSKVISLLFCSLDNIQVLSKANLRKNDIDKAIKIHDYLLGHLRSNFTVDQLADIVEIDKRKLEKAFKTIYRKGVHRFFLDEKLKHAALLLRDTNSPVKQITKEVGFHQESRFSEAFKKKYGFSPSEFRRLPVQ